VDLGAYLRIIRGRWIIVAASLAVALLAAWLGSTVAPVATATPTSYTATTLLLNTGGFGTGAFGSGGSTGLGLPTVAALTTIGEVADRVAEDLNYQGDPLTLAARVTASADTTAGTVRIRATSSKPREAEVLADTFAQELLGYLADRNANSTAAQIESIEEQRDKLDREIGALDQQIAATSGTSAEILTAERNAKITSYGTLSQQYQNLLSSQQAPIGLEVVQPAVARQISASGFQPPQSRVARMIVAAIVGVLIGVGIALVMERARPRIRTRAAAEKYSDAPVIAEIPRIRGKDRDGLVTAARPRSPTANAFRLLRAGMMAGTARGHPSAKTILVTSPGPSEGKTTVVANLAVAFADVGMSVLIMSCDFTRPRVHTLFGVPNVPGLAEGLATLNGRPILDGCLHETPVDDVKLVASGSRPENPSELLGSGNMRAAIREARKLADVVVVDTAPLLAEADAAQLVSYVDAVLVVVREGKTTTELAERAGAALRRLNAPIVGVVLNQAAEAVTTKYYHQVQARADK
jgi:capsular exopolysaccharide synthesis family protein